MQKWEYCANLDVADDAYAKNEIGAKYIESVYFFPRLAVDTWN